MARSSFDALGLPVVVETTSASPHGIRLVQGLLDFMLTDEPPERIIVDKAYDSDKLNDELAPDGIEMIAPHRRSRRPENATQDGRPLRRYKRRKDDRLAPALPAPVHPVGEVDAAVQGLSAPGMLDHVTSKGFGMGSNEDGVPRDDAGCDGTALERAPRAGSDLPC